MNVKFVIEIANLVKLILSRCRFFYLIRLCGRGALNKEINMFLKSFVLMVNKDFSNNENHGNTPEQTE